MRTVIKFSDFESAFWGYKQISETANKLNVIIGFPTYYPKINYYTNKIELNSYFNITNYHDVHIDFKKIASFENNN